MYYEGEGISQDHKRASGWFILAAEEGHLLAQSQLGVMYATGEGVQQNLETAVRWFTIAARRGLPSAQAYLSGMYALGKGVSRNLIRAHMWGKIAASNGNTQGGRVRDDVSEHMTPSQIEKAEKLARECIRKQYKGC